MGEEEGEEEEEHLLRTFEEIQYLIEDLDNANSMTSSTTLCIYHLVKLLFQLKLMFVMKLGNIAFSSSTADLIPMNGVESDIQLLGPQKTVRIIK